MCAGPLVSVRLSCQHAVVVSDAVVPLRRIQMDAYSYSPAFAVVLERFDGVAVAAVGGEELLRVVMPGDVVDGWPVA